MATTFLEPEQTLQFNCCYFDGVVFMNLENTIAKVKRMLVTYVFSSSNNVFISLPFYFNPFPNKPWFLHVLSTSLLKTLWEKEKLLVMSNFTFSPQCFLPVWRTFCHFHQGWNCRLQTLSVWKSLKFVIWERVKRLLQLRFVKPRVNQSVIWDPRQTKKTTAIQQKFLYSWEDNSWIIGSKWLKTVKHNFPYMIKFHRNRNKTRVPDTNLPIFCNTDVQTDKLIPVWPQKHLFCRGINLSEKKKKRQ